MKKTLIIIALILALSCLYTSTAFATTYNEDDYIEIWSSIIPGDVIVTLKADAPVVEDFASLLPELDIARIDRVYYWDDGRVELRIVLTEWTEQASLDAVEALSDNVYVESASECWMTNGLWEDNPYICLKGDTNNDDKVSNEDLVRVAKYIVSSIDNRAFRMKSADINQDGLITNADLIAIAKMVVSAA